MSSQAVRSLGDGLLGLPHLGKRTLQDATPAAGQSVYLEAHLACPVGSKVKISSALRFSKNMSLETRKL